MPQNTYTFGLNAEQYHGAATSDFLDMRNVAGEDENHNPYGANYFNDPEQMAQAPEDAKVTSIPSPYARMHITDIAFRELMAGVGILDEVQQRNHMNNMEGDYLRAMSHCLDVYEMLFRFKDLDLIDMGITVKKIELVTKRDGRYADLLAGNHNLSKFIDTLDLFRLRYLDDIRSKNVSAYKFDFTKMYIFKYKGRTFASTSPFTGFFAKADCDLTDANISVSWEVGRHHYSHKLFTNTEKEWLGIRDRDPKFIEFLYLLLRDDLGKVFTHLYAAVKACVPDVQALNNETFEHKYPEFNFGALVLPQIAGNTNNVAYIRPDGLDSSYLKYLLYLSEPIDLSITEDAYKKDITDREFPEGSGIKVQWIGVNDFLADALVILPYDINDNYYAMTYLDENNNPHRRCLLPLKRQALEYIDINLLNDLNLQTSDNSGNPNDEKKAGLKIKKYEDGHYAVTLVLPLTNRGYVELRRDYYSVNQESCTFPNGALCDLQNQGHHFAFGIYPFVRSEKYENIYKVLFYNDFAWPQGFHPEKNEKLYDLTFYYFDKDNRAKAYDRTTAVIENQTNKADADFNVNTHYFQVRDPMNIMVNDESIYINFVEMSLTLIKNPNSGSPVRFKATAIIAPKYHDVAPNPGWTNVAVDLGTSNTFIAYKHDGDNDAREISTIHDGWEELTLMNQHCDKPGISKINCDDLYLTTSNAGSKEADDYCLPAQLCEFIPTRIKQGTEPDVAGYSFPIPSIINNLRINSRNVNDFTDRIALVHSAIPFAYYSIGQRPNTEANRYDSMSSGEFKWFYRKNDWGVFTIDEVRKADFQSFLTELLFIVRSHMLCNGYELESCRLFWTYPLSFQRELIDFYQAAWSKVYCRYFNPSFLDATGENIAKPDLVEDYVKYTNESRSPIYECTENPAEANHLTILMDIGGGSTDIIGYKQNQPLFITSFGFAGNALYLGGSQNHPEDQLAQNYMRDFVKRSCESVFNDGSALKGTKKIDSDAPINTLMNYGFSEHATLFNAIFNNEPVQFMLQLHNAALIYHTAQLCKLKSPDEIPVKVYLTGNGSKLFKLDRNADFVRKIFDIVYNSTESVPTQSPRYPKAATAIGSLKGYERQGNQQLKFNADSADNQVVMLGDETTSFDIDANNPIAYLTEGEDYTNRVMKNVKHFIDVFYSVLNTRTPYFTKDQMLKCLNFVGDDPKLHFDMSISDSMFFQYISLLMEQLSIGICERMKNAGRR